MDNRNKFNIFADTIKVNLDTGEPVNPLVEDECDKDSKIVDPEAPSTGKTTIESAKIQHKIKNFLDSTSVKFDIETKKPNLVDKMDFENIRFIENQAIERENAWLNGLPDKENKHKCYCGIDLTPELQPLKDHAPPPLTEEVLKEALYSIQKLAFPAPSPIYKNWNEWIDLVAQMACMDVGIPSTHFGKRKDFDSGVEARMHVEKHRPADPELRKKVKMQQYAQAYNAPHITKSGRVRGEKDYLRTIEQPFVSPTYSAKDIKPWVPIKKSNGFLELSKKIEDEFYKPSKDTLIYGAPIVHVPKRSVKLVTIGKSYNGVCSECGSPADVLFTSCACSKPGCKNYRK
jgi:hypothetical protein